MCTTRTAPGDVSSTHHLAHEVLNNTIHLSLMSKKKSPS